MSHGQVADGSRRIPLNMPDRWLKRSAVFEVSIDTARGVFLNSYERVTSIAFDDSQRVNCPVLFGEEMLARVGDKSPCRFLVLPLHLRRVPKLAAGRSWANVRSLTGLVDECSRLREVSPQ